MVWRNILVGVDLMFIAGAVLFSYASRREKEPRAPWVGAGAVLMLLAAGVFILVWPAGRILGTVLFAFLMLGGIALFIPRPPDEKAAAGSQGYVRESIKRFDERDVVFARNRSLPAGSDVYRRYYDKHPGREARDAIRRKRGGPVGKPGAIDRGYRSNVAMVKANFTIPDLFGPVAHAFPEAAENSADISPAKAAKIVKGFARHLGASLVGICRVNPQWVYSHRGEIFDGNWHNWGQPIENPLPFAVVIATEMGFENVGTAPHTPTLMESAFNYGKGAYISTVLSQWFAGMGYRGVAHHSRHYDMPLVPLAIDAGLGELGRFGYLIARTYGARVRLFAVTTDMPMATDRPVDLGVNTFCERCMKCAEACPSRSIPRGGKTVFNGVEKWKLDEDSCFEYWGRVGTDCSVCMAVCPFSRPDHTIHRLARRFLKRSLVAPKVFPYLDNWIYGRKWRSRSAPGWIDPQR